MKNGENPTRKYEKGRKSNKKKLAKRLKSGKISPDLVRSRPFSARSQLDLAKSRWIQLDPFKKIPDLLENITGSVNFGFLEFERWRFDTQPPISVFGEQNPLLTTGAIGSVGSRSSSVSGDGWVRSGESLDSLTHNQQLWENDTMYLIHIIKKLLNTLKIQKCGALSSLMFIVNFDMNLISKNHI